MSVVSTSVNNPWISDRHGRCLHLFSLIDAQKSAEHVAQKISAPADSLQVAVECKLEDTAISESVRRIFCNDHSTLPIDTLPTEISQSLLHQVKKAVVVTLGNQTGDGIEAALNHLITQLPIYSNDPYRIPYLRCIVEESLNLYFTTNNGIVSQSLCEAIKKLVTVDSMQSFLFETILPRIVLAAGTNCSWVLHLLETAPDHSNIEFLKTFSAANDLWSSESHPIVRFLLESVSAESLPDDWRKEFVRSIHSQLSLNDKLYESTSFANLIMIFLRKQSSQLDPQSWGLLAEVAEKQRNFLRIPLCRLIPTSSTEPSSPVY